MLACLHVLPPHRQNQPPQRQLPRHGSVPPHTAPGEEGDEGHGQRYARRGAVLGDLKGGEGGGHTCVDGPMHGAQREAQRSAVPGALDWYQ
jgi:hypothetical protein